MELSAVVQRAGIVFAIVTLRYLIVAGAAFLFFWVWKKDQWADRRIQSEPPAPSKMWFEFRYSMMSMGIFALLSIGVMYARQAGWTQIYTNVSDYGWGWFFGSIIVMILLHDAYFYWAHRFMHIPVIFKYAHKVHHHSTNPSPWAAFSFHPIETLLEFAIVPVFLMIMPIHPIALMTVMVFMTLMNVLGHLGYEVYPSGFTTSRWTLWNNTPVHHNMHHKFVNCNYGLYFNWWDRLFKTNHERYHETFEGVVAGERIARPAQRTAA